ncbi:putative membrane protein [Streptomyces avermitilis MA-4680 = NBRC 14893]|uniref:Membrane protein n=1 Tax=Streptomyces avermitilis (strain ATCC 31267 / DSM 46492 / JCM 5070 / NBRC 14893 / NCIMB 12804 / NRRL 8165 / MA-4680) TaxID=227882 RepID=Q82RL9_STRAW|nr:putative membrane protein [Streptomyces avermitilis MA-4680 = NBRC 14893]
MAALWAAEAALTPGEVQAELASDLARTTVTTILSRLYDKGVVDRRGVAMVTTPCRTPRGSPPGACIPSSTVTLTGRPSWPASSPSSIRTTNSFCASYWRPTRDDRPLLIPLLLPFVMPLLARRALDRLAPATALWALTAAALVLAGACVTALGALVLTGLLKLPAFAALGELAHPLRTPTGYLVLPAAAIATGLLTIGAWTLAHSALRQTRAFRTARAEADRRPTAGDLCVVDSPHPDAYALPGRPHRIVVTTAMLRSLKPDERDALFAHERAHNQGATTASWSIGSAACRPGRMVSYLGACGARRAGPMRGRRGPRAIPVVCRPVPRSCRGRIVGVSLPSARW